jgi:hypothetical protein
MKNKNILYSLLAVAVITVAAYNAVLHITVSDKNAASLADGTNLTSLNAYALTTGENMATQPIPHNGRCKLKYSYSGSFSKEQVKEAKVALGYGSSIEAVYRFLAKIGTNVSLNGNGNLEYTTSGSLHYSFHIDDEFTYSWVQCLNNNTVPCTPVPKYSCGGEN